MGKIPILTNIFQMGWNHQPVKPTILPRSAPGMFLPKPGRTKPLVSPISQRPKNKQSLLEDVFFFLSPQKNRGIWIKKEGKHFFFSNLSPGNHQKIRWLAVAQKGLSSPKKGKEPSDFPKNDFHPELVEWLMNEPYLDVLGS